MKRKQKLKLTTMMATWFYILVYLSSLGVSCPTWFYSNGTACVCREEFSGRVYCNSQEEKAEIEDGFCATYDEQEGQIYAGDCPFRHTENNTDRVFSELPSDPEQLNNTMCGPYNRKGLLCGKCIDGYGPAMYSIDMKCANCSKMSTGAAISLYVFLEFIPITIFYIIVVIFRLNITSGPLLGYVLFCQIHIFSMQWSYLYIHEYILSHVSTSLRVLYYSSLTLSSSWILQFFKFAIQPFCICNKLTDFHIQLLNLVTAIYPIVLVIITWILMELHARNYRIIHILWKPFSILLKKLKITSVTSDAVVHAFATFILLSTLTVICSVANVFINNPVYQSIDASLYKTVLFTDPTIVWYSHKHILYILITSLPFVLLVLIPSLLLCVYPTRIYGCLSRVVSARKRLVITAFAEALNNCFKDGLNGTRDYRALAGLIMLTGIVCPMIRSIVDKAIPGYSRRSTSGLVLIFISFFLSYIRPCKSTITNMSLSYHFMIVGILSITLELWKNDMSTTTESLKMTFIIVPVISHVLVLSWAGYALSCRITSHFGYQCNLKAILTDLANALRHSHSRRGRSGYQVLSNTV